MAGYRDDSAGGYGQWGNDDLSWLDYLKAKGSDIGGGAYNVFSNITGALSPIGTSPEGNMSLQVPPMVSGIADSYSRLAGTPSQPGNAYNLSGVPEFDAPIQQDMSNVLLSLYGGNALNPLARRPVGSVGAGMGEQPKGITAYHGSPHDFDKFSLDKIGTGEGAQAYGHGLYFADSEGVAKSYRDALAPRNTEPPAQTAKWAIDEAGGDVAAAIEKVRGSMAWKEANGGLADVDRAKHLDAISMLENGTHNGRMYQVRINADPDSFLDWDKPLSQQPDAARGVIESDPLLSTEMYSSAPDNFMRNAIRDPNTTDRLREAGIPGIRYLDGQSRADGAGSSNYVVFDDSLIEILKKYGMAGGALGAGALTQPDQASAQDVPDWLKF